jgi:hypothetical protein
MRDDLSFNTFRRLFFILSTALLMAAGGGVAAQSCSVAPPSNQPVANDDTVDWTAPGADPAAARDIDVLANDYNTPTSEPLTLISVGNAIGGTPSIVGSLVHFVKNGGATSGSFTYSVMNPAGVSATATVTLAGADANTSVSFTWVCPSSGYCRFTPVISSTQLVQSFTWSFGDNTTATGGNLHVFYHQYLSTGTKSVAMVVTFTSGAAVSYAASVQVTDRGPGLTWSVEPSLHQGSLCPTIDWTMSDGVSGDTVDIDWGDGRVDHNVPWSLYSSNRAAHCYPVADSWTVTLFWTRHSTGQVFPYVRVLEVSNQPPVVSLTSAASSSNAKSFTVTASVDYDDCRAFLPEGCIVRYVWDFGDGRQVTTTTKSVSVDYVRPGAHLVTLTAVDEFEGSATATLTIDVPNYKPAVGLAFFCTGRSCTFAAAATDDDTVSSYKWTFDAKGDVTDVPASAFTFRSDGDFVVTVVANDGTLDSLPASRVVSIRTDTRRLPLGFAALNPCRAYDSRDARLAPEGQLKAGVARTIPLTNCGVDARAASVAVNITVVSPAAAGHIIAFSPNQGTANATALTFDPVTSPRANNILAPADGGSITLVSAVDTQVVIDVTGYFTATGTAAANGLTTVAPCRLWDTRDPAQFPGATRLGWNTSSYVKAQGKCGLPADTGAGSAAALNITAIAPSSGGNLLLYPSSLSGTGTAAVNFNSGVTQANGALMALGRRAADDLAVYYLAATSSTTDYTVDVNGYFNSTGKLKYYPILPCRIADTRDASRGDVILTGGQPQAFQVQGNCGIPNGAAAAFVNAAVVGAGGTGFLQLRPSGTPAPATPTLNFANGEVALTNGTIVPLNASATSYLQRDLTASAYIPLAAGAQGATHLVLDVYGYFADPAFMGASSASVERQ